MKHGEEAILIAAGNVIFLSIFLVFCVYSCNIVHVCVLYAHAHSI
jgi:hypothetical protein